MLLPATPSMGLSGRVVSVRVKHPGSVRLLLGFGPGHSPAASGVLSGQSHASVIVSGSDSDNRELGLMVELFVRNGRQAGAKFIPEDASKESRVPSPDGGSSTSCQPTHRAFEKVCGSTFWGINPFFLAAPCAWLAAAASAGEAAGLSATCWTGGGLARKVRKTSAMPGKLSAWLRTQAH